MAELVTDYLEGTLPWTSKLGAGWHLFQCKACSRYFDQFRRTIRLLADAPSPDSTPNPAADAVAERVLSRLRSGAQPQAGDD
jgi:anti-sigma factor RsiW